MAAAVDALKTELAGSSRPEPPDVKGCEEEKFLLEDMEHFLRQHGLDAEELKGVWAHVLEGLKDLPTSKPLVTMLGVFLLGFMAGRTRRE